MARGLSEVCVAGFAPLRSAPCPKGPGRRGLASVIHPATSLSRLGGPPVDVQASARGRFWIAGAVPRCFCTIRPAGYSVPLGVAPATV